MKNAVDRIVDVFQRLTPDALATLDAIYAPDARFKDPFNEVRGRAQIQRIFRHMYQSLENPRFVIKERMVQGNQCFLTWEFHFGLRQFKPGQAQCIVGATHLVLDDAGQITLHRDYWDAAEELYEKLPLLGTLLRWLKRRIGSDCARP